MTFLTLPLQKSRLLILIWMFIVQVELFFGVAMFLVFSLFVIFMILQFMRGIILFFWLMILGICITIDLVLMVCFGSFMVLILRRLLVIFRLVFLRRSRIILHRIWWVLFVGFSGLMIVRHWFIFLIIFLLILLRVASWRCRDWGFGIIVFYRLFFSSRRIHLILRLLKGELSLMITFFFLEDFGQ